eukprot:m51a1_g4438 putative domain containing protein (648) ;mRNA; f:101111-103633
MDTPGGPDPASAAAAAATAAAAPAAPGAAALMAQRISSFVDAASSTLDALVALSAGFEGMRREEFEQGRARAKEALGAAVDALLAREIGLTALADARQSRENHRHNVVAELSATEDDYLKDLLVMQNVWEPEMKKAGVVSQQDLHVMFSTMGQLVMLASELSKHLAAAKSLPGPEQRVGEIFKKNIPFMKVYIEYAVSQVQATEIIQNAAKSSKFRDFMEKLRAAQPAVRGMDVTAYLIKPTQRITKYPLFLADLIKHTPQDHPDYKGLEEALEAMRDLLKMINRRTSEREARTLLARVLPGLSWRTEPAYDLLNSRCKLLAEGYKIATSVSGLQDKGNALFLFDNLLVVLVAKDKDHYQEIASFPTAGLGVQGTSNNIIFLTHGVTQLTCVFPDLADALRWESGFQSAIAQSADANPLLKMQQSKSKVSKKEERERANTISSPLASDSPTLEVAMSPVCPHSQAEGPRDPKDAKEARPTKELKEEASDDRLTKSPIKKRSTLRSLFRGRDKKSEEEAKRRYSDVPPAAQEPEQKKGSPSRPLSAGTAPQVSPQMSAIESDASVSPLYAPPPAKGEEPPHLDLVPTGEDAALSPSLASLGSTDKDKDKGRESPVPTAPKEKTRETESPVPPLSTPTCHQFRLTAVGF